jgi:hypothetical protein
MLYAVLGKHRSKQPASAETLSSSILKFSKKRLALAFVIAGISDAVGAFTTPLPPIGWAVDLTEEQLRRIDRHIAQLLQLISLQTTRIERLASFGIDTEGDGCFTVLVTVLVYLLLILFGCVRVDDRVVAFAVVVSAKPHHDVLRERDFIHEIVLATYFRNVQHHLCFRRWHDLQKHQ